MAYEIPLLQPLVLQGVLERFPVQESHTLLNRVPKTSHPFPSASWEITRGARAIAQPNVPNSEANIVPHLSRSSKSATFAYLREKKVFTPTTIHWLRQAAASLSDLNKTNATEAVTREIGDLNNRFDNYAEYLLWRALTGSVEITYAEGNSEVVDYGFLDSHKATASTPWANATAESIIGDVRALKRIVERDGRVPATEAYTSTEVMDAIFAAFTSADSHLLSDRMRDQYYGTGELPSFLGLNWKIQDAVYDTGDAAYSNTGNPDTDTGVTRYLDENFIVLGNLDAGRPVELLNGPSADDDAPSGFTGKFVKTWKAPDPSARQYLLEWNLMPVITKPDQIATLSVG